MSYTALGTQKEDSRRDPLGFRDSPRLAAPAEADSGEGVARVRVVSVGGVVQLRTGDSGVEGLDGRRRAVHDGGAGVDDSFEFGVGSL